MAFIDFVLLHIDDYWNEWIKQYGKKLSSKRRKKDDIGCKIGTYQHFSKKITTIEEVQKLKGFILGKKNIKNHSFKPLLFFFKKIPIFERIPTKYKKHKKLSQNPLKPYKVRPLMYADHLDSVIYSWYSYIISTGYEEKLKDLGIGEFVAAYRNDTSSSKKKTNSSVSEELFNILKCGDPKKKYKVILYDVQKFYDTLDPLILKKMWCHILGTKNLPDDHFCVFKSIIEYTVVDKKALSMYMNNHKSVNLRTRNIGKLCTEKEFHDIRRDGLFIGKELFISTISQEINPEKPREFYELTKAKPIHKGIPQGLVISPTLANIYMLNFDYQVGTKIKEWGGFYRRYADDIGIVCEDHYSEQIKNLITEEIQKLKLVIQNKKTQEYICEDGKVSRLDNCTNGDKLAFTYLGLTFRDGKGYIRNGTIAKGHQAINKIIKHAFGMKKDGLNVDSQDVYKKIMNLGLFRYIKMCSKDHGTHLLKQFSKKKIRKKALTVVKQLDNYTPRETVKIKK